MADIKWTSIICVVAVAFAAAAVLTRILIPYLRKWAGQNIREEGPKAHLSKQGTPSMGGIAIVTAILIGSAFGGFFGHAMIIMDIGMLIFAAVGFLDDYLKVIKKENEGLKVKPKFAFQFIGALAIAVYIAYFSGFGTGMYIPFFKVTVDLGIWYVPFIVFTILAMVNAVNLTDGLDGLASGTTAIVSLFLMLVALKAGAAGSVGFCAAILGACLGFLVWNHHPAKVFMGDTGSLALGGAVTMADCNAVLGINWWQSALMHVILFPVSILFGIVLLNTFRNKKSIWTFFGQNTMPIYIFHLGMKYAIMHRGAGFGFGTGFETGFGAGLS